MGERIKIMFLVVGAIIISLGVAELALRGCAPIPYSMKVEYEPDAFLGQRLVPDRVYTLADGGQVRINGHGFRGPDFDTTRAQGVLRVLALGGSSTFSYQTDDAEIWTRRLEEKLQGEFGPDVEVVNAGIPGYSVLESTVHYLVRLRELEADVAVVYHTWNDLKHFRRVEAGQTLRANPYRRDPLRSFLREFQLAWRVRSLWWRGTLPPRDEGHELQSVDEAPEIRPGGPAHLWARRSYDTLARLLRTDGVIPVFASQAGLLAKENLQDDAVRQVVYTEYQGLGYEELLTQWLALGEIIRASAEASGASFVDVWSAVPHTLEYFHDHVHLTPLGNEAVAESLFRGLRTDPRFREAVAR